MSTKIWKVLILVVITLTLSLCDESADKVENVDNQSTEIKSDAANPNQAQFEDIEPNDVGESDEERTDEENLQHAKEELDREVKKYLKLMHIEDQESIDKETFKKLVVSVLLRGEEIPEGEKELFNKICDKIAEVTPEPILTANISSYLELENLSNIINQVLSEYEGGEDAEDNEEDEKLNIEAQGQSEL